MLFRFIKYTTPGWQFNLTPSLKQPYATCYIEEEECYKDMIDERYETKSARLADLGFRLWNKGTLLLSTPEQIARLKQLEKPSLTDEYIFIRKYWGEAWTTFALVLRICTFKNPFREIKNYLQTQGIKKIDIFNHSVLDNKYNSFDSLLIRSNPKVAVIVPTLNRYAYLKNVLHDLEKQSYKNFEVIIVDQSQPFNASFYNQFNLDIKVVKQKEKLLWTARNKAVKLTEAQWLLFLTTIQELNHIGYFII